MMKKLNISSQILLLFFALFLGTTFVFTFGTLFSMNIMAQQQVYTRLESYVIILSNDRDINRPHQLSDMNVSFIVKKWENTPVFSNTEEYITEDEFYKLIETIKSAREEGDYTRPSYMVQGQYNTENGNHIYYVCNVENNFDGYTFIFTDSTFTTGFVKGVTLRIFTVYLAIILLCVACIYLWSSHLTRRIHDLQLHILELPKNKYEKSYVDASLDEIGDLSRSVESMRVEIGHNEHTKQEMLQNLSHDFKTPIAVIKSYAEAIQDGMAGPEAVDVIISQADLLKKKVNRLLQYNSLEYLTKDKPFEDINMNELVNQVVMTYKFQTDLKFTLDFADNVIFQGYRENWSTVVENIVDNAKRYAKTEIKIILRDGFLQIYNDGEPIDEQFLNSVFKPYEKGSKGEFGLGMSIVKKTIDFFGMTLKVKNEPEGGVSFIITRT